MKAYDSDKNSVTLSWDGAWLSEHNHYHAAVSLMEKMGWTGTIVGGEIEKGKHVWVFTN